MFDLHESLDMCLNLLSSALRDRVEVHRDYGPIGRVFGPGGQLNQVFMNMLNNAQQAIEGEGEIIDHHAAGRRVDQRSAFATPAAAFRPSCATRFSIRSSRPRSRAWAPGWGCRSATA